MEVHLPGFNFAIIWLVLAIQLVVAGVVVALLRWTTKLPLRDIMKGAILFVLIAMAISAVAIWYIIGVYDEELRVNAVERLGYTYVVVEEDVWVGVNEAQEFERGIFEQTGPETWSIKVLPYAVD